MLLLNQESWSNGKVFTHVQVVKIVTNACIMIDCLHHTPLLTQDVLCTRLSVIGSATFLGQNEKVIAILVSTWPFSVCTLFVF